jgi:transcriptional regulator with XRE-family HTH domain
MIAIQLSAVNTCDDGRKRLERSEALAAVINRWKEESGKSLNQLAQKTELGYSTIRALTEGKSDPNGETALRILLYIYQSNIAAVHRFILEFYPELTAYTQSLVDANTRGIELPELTPVGMRLFLEVACSPEGITENRAADILGTSGARQLEKLVEQGVMKSVEGQVVRTNEVVYVLSSTMQKQIAGYTVESIDTTQATNQLHVGFEGVNEQAEIKIYDIIKNANEQIMQVMKDSGNKGSNKVVVTLGMTKI